MNKEKKKLKFKGIHAWKHKNFIIPLPSIDILIDELRYHYKTLRIELRWIIFSVEFYWREEEEQ